MNWLFGIYNKNYYVYYYLQTVCYTSFRSVKFIINVFACVCTLFFLGNLLISIYQHTIFEQLQSYLMLNVMPSFYVLHNMFMNFTLRERVQCSSGQLFSGKDWVGMNVGVCSGWFWGAVGCLSRAHWESTYHSLNIFSGGRSPGLDTGPFGDRRCH